MSLLAMTTHQLDRARAECEALKAEAHNAKADIVVLETQVRQHIACANKLQADNERLRAELSVAEDKWLEYGTELTELREAVAAHCEQLRQLEDDGANRRGEDIHEFEVESVREELEAVLAKSKP